MEKNNKIKLVCLLGAAILCSVSMSFAVLGVYSADSQESIFKGNVGYQATNNVCADIMCQVSGGLSNYNKKISFKATDDKTDDKTESVETIDKNALTFKTFLQEDGSVLANNIEVAFTISDTSAVDSLSYAINFTKNLSNITYSIENDKNESQKIEKNIVDTTTTYTFKLEDTELNASAELTWNISLAA